MQYRCIHSVGSQKFTITVDPRTDHKGPEGEQMYSSNLFVASAVWWSTPRPGRFTPGKDPLSIVWETGWTPEPVWTDAENLAPTGIRSPNRPAQD